MSVRILRQKPRSSLLSAVGVTVPDLHSPLLARKAAEGGHKTWRPWYTTLELTVSHIRTFNHNPVRAYMVTNLSTTTGVDIDWEFPGYDMTRLNIEKVTRS